MIGAGHGGQKACSGALPAAVIGFGIALLNWHVLMMPIDIAPIAPGTADNLAAITQAGASPDRPQVVSATAFPAMLARPLFRADRRPAEAAKADTASVRSAQPQKQVRLPDGLALVGIVKQGGETGARALIRSPTSETGQWVEVGYVLEGWRLSRIEAASIQFEADGSKQSLSLFPQKSE